MLADYCLIDLVDEDGRLDRVVMSHVDPGGEEVLRDLRERFPPDFNEAHPASRVLATGQPLVFEDVTRDVLAEASISDEHLEHYLRLEPCSYMVVPLTARGRRLGTLSFGTSVSGRRYGPEELVLARELADRAAVAVDNAVLYQHELEVAQALQRGLLPPALPSVPGIEVAVTYRPAAFDAQGNYAISADVLFRSIGAIVAPNDPPPTKNG